MGTDNNVFRTFLCLASPDLPAAFGMLTCFINLICVLMSCIKKAGPKGTLVLYLHYAAVFSPLVVAFLSFPFIFLPSSITGTLSGIPSLAGLWCSQFFWRRHQKTWLFGAGILMFYVRESVLCSNSQFLSPQLLE